MVLLPPEKRGGLNVAAGGGGLQNFQISGAIHQGGGGDCVIFTSSVSMSFTAVYSGLEDHLTLTSVCLLIYVCCFKTEWIKCLS